MSFSSTSGSASASSTAPSSLFTEDEARFMRDSFNNLQESFDPFSVGAPGFKVPSVLPPTVGGLPPFQQNAFNNSRSSLNSSLQHTKTITGSPVHTYGASAQSPGTPTNYSHQNHGEGVTPSSQHTASPPANNDAVALARLKGSESWERNAAKQPSTFFDQSWWTVAQNQHRNPSDQQQHEQVPHYLHNQRPSLSVSQRSASDTRANNMSPTSMDTASTHSRSSSALEALMMGMGPPVPQLPFSAPPSDAYADLLHLQDKNSSGHSPDPTTTHAPAAGTYLPQAAGHDSFGGYMRSGMQPSRDDGSSYPLTSAPAESYVDLYTVPATGGQARKGPLMSSGGTSGWAPPPQLIASLQQQQNRGQLSHPQSVHDQQAQQPASHALHSQHLAAGGAYSHPQPPLQPAISSQDSASSLPVVPATASGEYGRDKAYQMEQMSILQLQREKWGATSHGQNPGANAQSASGATANGHASLSSAMGLQHVDEDTVMHEHEHRGHGPRSVTSSGVTGAGSAGNAAGRGVSANAHSAFNIMPSSNANELAHARHRTASGSLQHQQPSPQRQSTGAGVQPPANAASPQGQPIPPSGHLSILGLSMSTSHTFPNKTAFAHGPGGPGMSPQQQQQHQHQQHNGVINGPSGEYAGSPSSAPGSTPGAGGVANGFRVTSSALSPHSPPGPSGYGQQGPSPISLTAANAHGSAGAGPQMSAKRGRDSSFKSTQDASVHGTSAKSESPTNVRTPSGHQSAGPGHGGDTSNADRPILSLSKSRNRTASMSVASPATPTGMTPSGSQGTRLASTFATRRAPLIRPPRQAIAVDVDLARGHVPEQISWAFFTSTTSDRSQPHVDGIVDLRKGPAVEEERPGSAAANAADDGSAAGGSSAAAKKQKQGHVLLTEAEKKANHIASEQKRRANIRKGYEMLCDIVPPLKEALEREAAVKEGGGTVGGGAAGGQDDDEDDEEETTATGRKKKRKVKKRDPDAAGCEIGGERIDGRAGPRSEAIVLMKSIEYLRDLLEIHRDLTSRRDHARHQAAQACGINIATYLGPPVPNAQTIGGGGASGAGRSYFDNGDANDDAMQH